MATSIVLTLCQAISQVLSICINSFNSTFRIYITTQSIGAFPAWERRMQGEPQAWKLWFFCTILGGPWLALRVLQRLVGYAVKSRGRRYSCQTGLEAAVITCRGTNKAAFPPHNLPFTPLGPKQSPSLLTHAKQAAYCQGTPYSFWKLALIIILAQFYWCLDALGGKQTRHQRPLGRV